MPALPWENKAVPNRTIDAWQTAHVKKGAIAAAASCTAKPDDQGDMKCESVPFG